MFVRWKRTKRLRRRGSIVRETGRVALVAMLVKSERRDGQPRQVVMAYLGTIGTDRLGDAYPRRWFWEKCDARLAALALEPQIAQDRNSNSCSAPQALPRRNRLRGTRIGRGHESIRLCSDHELPAAGSWWSLRGRGVVTIKRSPLPICGHYTRCCIRTDHCSKGECSESPAKSNRFTSEAMPRGSSMRFFTRGRANRARLPGRVGQPVAKPARRNVARCHGPMP